MDTYIDISEIFKGACTPNSILQKEGRIDFRYFLPTSREKIVIFEITANNFHFYLICDDRNLTLHRNGKEATISLDELLYQDYVYVIISWSPTKLYLIIRRNEKTIKLIDIDTPHTIPSKQSYYDAKMQKYIPATQYDSEEKMRQAVNLILEDIDSFYYETGRIEHLWDVKYGPNGRIEQRTPKKETDAQGAILSIFYDRTFIANLSVQQENKTAVGPVDFAFQGVINDHIANKYCVEVKNAHSSDLEHGLFVQLPEYMRREQVSYGAYLILWSKGEWFDEPKKFNDPHSLKVYLSSKMNTCEDSIVQSNIDLYIVDISKHPSASKM